MDAMDTNLPAAEAEAPQQQTQSIDQAPEAPKPASPKRGGIMAFFQSKKRAAGERARCSTRRAMTTSHTLSGDDDEVTALHARRAALGL